MAKFEQMITQDEYYACIKGCQIIDCVARNKDYFHFVEKMSKRRGTMSERKVAKRAGGFYKGDVPGKCAGNLSVGDGAMLMADTHGVAFHDGKERQSIFNEAQFKK